MSKYLSYCNVWPVERLTFEFRQIHSNKLSHVFSSSNKAVKSKDRASFSPFGIDINDGSSSTPNILINPHDGRRYKKTVVEEHLQNMTFSPRLN